MQGAIIFDPLLDWLVLAGALALMAVVLCYAVWQGLSGWFFRALAAILVIVALANPSFQAEDRTSLSDIVVLLVDDTASQRISDRPDQVNKAIDAVRARIEQIPNTELRIVNLGDAPGDAGTLLITRLSAALAEIPRARIAGAILLSDGQVHDIDLAQGLPAPVHLLLTGHKSDWDRRLVVSNAPAFAILGEPVSLSVRIEDQGNVPFGVDQTAVLGVSIDGEASQSFPVPVGQDFEFPLTVEHGGINVLQFSVQSEIGELTSRNNSAVVQINGVRDRLRVLLVSGEPYPGERTWRNLLKSDSSVDLVHFTILRPPQKQDRVPVAELSLIAFPTRELFLDKITEFDLIIFDRYRLRGILPALYLENVRRYVEEGGAVLISAGPGFASADSLFRSPLGQIIPAEPTSRVIENGFLPQVTDIGARHPVTEGLADQMPKSVEKTHWGRWFRQIEVAQRAGQVVMSGAEEKPLLVLDRVGLGRIALLASDQAWLWSRGFEGGGPQLELLRRLAHWMMKEPDLEEEALTTTNEGQKMTITRRTLGDGPRAVEITGPNGTANVLEMLERSPGRFQAEYDAPDMGLYRLKQGAQELVVALGPSAPREFVETIATPDILADLVKESRGGTLLLEDGFPDIRTVQPGRVAAGRGWIAITPRQAFATADIRITSLVPAWLFVLLASLFSVVAWLREGRR